MKELDWKLFQGDSETVLSGFPDEYFDCCVTSPPYYALRDYGVKGQIGLENTPDEYIEKLVSVFREVRRVLKNDGTLWVNIGDTYAGSGKGAGGSGVSSGKQKTNKGSNFLGKQRPHFQYDCKPKDLIGIPWMLAFALRNDGWYLRQDIIWSKPNPMPESVTDRCTKSHEYIFLFSKSPKYYFDNEAIKTDANPLYADRYKYGFFYGEEKHGSDRINNAINTSGIKQYSGKANKRSVWNIPTNVAGYKDENGAHYATYSTLLIEPCILAGCKENGTVLDPFNGSGTTGVCALENGRNYVGIDLSEKYITIATKRLRDITDQQRLF